MSAPVPAYRVDDDGGITLKSDFGQSTSYANYHYHNHNHYSLDASTGTAPPIVAVPVDIQGGHGVAHGANRTVFGGGRSIDASVTGGGVDGVGAGKCCDASSLMECGVPDACTNEIREENLIKRQQRKTSSTNGDNGDYYYQMNSNKDNALDNRNPIQRFVERERNLLIACLVLVVATNISTGRYMLYPFMILSTWVHEMCHGLAAIMMGGYIAKLEIFKDGSGLAYTAGVNTNFRCGFVSAAGYPGTGVVGCLLLLFRRTTLGPTIGTIGLGCVMILSVALWVRNTWGLVVLLLQGVSLVLFGWKLPAVLLDNLYSFLALTCCLNAFERIQDLFAIGDLYVGGEVVTSTDAHTVADMWGMDYRFWAIAWLCFSVLMSAVGIVFAFDAKRFVTTKMPNNNTAVSLPLVDAEVIQVYHPSSPLPPPPATPTTENHLIYAQPYGGEHQNKCNNNSSMSSDGVLISTNPTKSKRGWFRFGGKK